MNKTAEQFLKDKGISEYTTVDQHVIFIGDEWNQGSTQRVLLTKLLQEFTKDQFVPKVSGSEWKVPKDMFAEIKLAISAIHFNNLRMSRDGSAIEANPASHKIAEYFCELLENFHREYLLPSTPSVDVGEEKFDLSYEDVMITIQEMDWGIMDNSIDAKELMGKLLVLKNSKAKEQNK